MGNNAQQEVLELTNLVRKLRNEIDFLKKQNAGEVAKAILNTPLSEVKVDG